MTATDQVWLTKEQQHAWRAYLRASRALEVRLDTELQGAGLSFAEYELLSMLSEAPEGSMRMSQLADLIIQSRSRVTHTANRLERRGWVVRSDAPEDRRGVVLSLTVPGWDTVRRAARLHVQGVREHFIEQIGASDLEVLGDAMDAVRRHLTGKDTEVA
ncbi:MarR family transcriptional regulator [Allobranchiibius huperziae]|uniref:DNA-binding MarR family transcriptional regulator n=1 Tax=Allobranchiibius huperziae TaxID=1874116 RepID=A0A853DF37_9MICO|nr:DNA-binding MarR family transcriptional regulator [Allobranchiibius huperziae]